MSARRLPRELGVVLKCNHEGCNATLTTAVIVFKHNRAYAAKLGWSRGLVKPKRRDLCPEHAKLEVEKVAAAKKALAEQRAARDAARRAAKLAPAQQEASPG